MVLATVDHKHEVAEVFKRYGEHYRARHRLPRKQASVMLAIERCRSSALGYHIDACDHCGHLQSFYNSCRDRHCPKCQGINRRKWVQARLEDLLPVPYYHVVFTLPDSFFPLCLFNQQVIYDLLFDTAAQTLLTFGRDEKWLGGQMGFFGILHTWGQTMGMHPHVHFVVPGGAMDEKGDWVAAKHKGKFLFPVRGLSKVFRGKMIGGLKSAYCKGQLSFPGKLAQLSSEDAFSDWMNQLCSKEWVVFAKPPFSGPKEVVTYVGRYTHRVAISNPRIVSVGGERVVFRYKDYAKGNKVKEMSLSAEAFIERFLWHVLPSGFHKIRHFGFLANGRKGKLRHILAELRLATKTAVDPVEEALPEKVHGLVCPTCGKARLHPVVLVTALGELIVKDLAFVVKYAKERLGHRPPEVAWCLGQ
jgi:hypothetical protein